MGEPLGLVVPAQMINQSTGHVYQGIGRIGQQGLIHLRAGGRQLVHGDKLPPHAFGAKSDLRRSSSRALRIECQRAIEKLLGHGNVVEVLLCRALQELRGADQRECAFAARRAANLRVGTYQIKQVAETSEDAARQLGEPQLRLRYAPVSAPKIAVDGVNADNDLDSSPVPTNAASDSSVGNNRLTTI